MKLLLFCILTVASTVRAQDKPNIIVILGDDLGIDGVSCLNPDLGLKTPAIDRLAREGMSFTDAHSTSGVCSPTRYGLLTGRYNWRSRLKRGIVGKWERPLIADSRVTLPELLKRAGYDTACIGKWHLGWRWPRRGGGVTSRLKDIDFTGSVKGGPLDHGFDYYFGDDVPNWPPYVWCEDDRLLGELTDSMKQGAMVGVSPGPAVKGWDFRAVLHEYGRRVSRYVEEQARSEKPFFLYFPMPSPHTPIAPHGDFQGRSKISEYADFLIQTDAVVGQLLDALDRTDLSENTLVFFTCDNGTSPKCNFKELEAAGVHLRKNFRGWKADAFEGGHRVPFLVRWPGRVKRGTLYPHPITLADIMATCAEATGQIKSDDMAEDSASLVPILEGRRTQPLHQMIVHHSGGGHFAVRKGRWKLLFCRGSGGWSPPTEGAARKQELPAIQLYDLVADPKETRNLHARHPKLVKQLTDEFRRLVEAGRSTPGAPQPNHGNKKWWKGLPWPKP